MREPSGLVVGAAWASVLGMVLSILSNTAANCEISVASHLFEACRPYGLLVDLGHAVAAGGAIPVAIALGMQRRAVIDVQLTAMGVAALVVVTGMHLALASGLVDHRSSVWSVVWAWGIVGSWVLLRSLPRMPPTTSLLGAILGATALAWAIGFPIQVANDAVRQAGGGLFAIGFPIWVAWSTRSLRHSTSGIRFSSNSLLAWVQRAAIFLGSLFLALPALVVWAAATCQVALLPADPAVGIEVRNETKSTLTGRSINARDGTQSVGPGSREKILIRLGYPTDIDYSLSDRTGRAIACRAGAYETLRAHSRFVVQGDPPVCNLDRD